MKSVFHICSECYPAAKAGGMGDVVGALPIYLPEHGINASVVIPKYNNKWFRFNKFRSIKKGTFLLGNEWINYEVQKLKGVDLGFPFYCIDIPNKFDRENIYLDSDGHGYSDEPERNIAFQTAVLEWLSKSRIKIDIIHCHDHMTALITFFVKYCPAYKKLKNIPTLLTIHNGQYRGIFDWSIEEILPSFNQDLNGWLDWDGMINSLATGIKCAWAVNTVSHSYMIELKENSDTLTHLYEYESDKCLGILNGIDNNLWNPETDNYLDVHLENGNWHQFKNYHKSQILKTYGLKGNGPLIGYIGRFAHQKGADLLEDAIRNCLDRKEMINVIILGSGDKSIEDEFAHLASQYPNSVSVIIAYDEELARTIYAGTDFLIMPSRFEPCGLNQMYAMRYGSIPMVSDVGGLKDTVPDINNNGNGIVFKNDNVRAIEKAISRSIKIFNNKNRLTQIINKITPLDHSWSKSAEEYANLYLSLLNHTA